MNNKTSQYYFIINESKIMSDTEILLSNNANNEEKRKAAENIITNYDLPLDVEQILLAFGKVLDWINIHHDKEFCKNNRLFLLSKVLNINKNMYIAIILGLCEKIHISRLAYLIIFSGHIPIDIGLNKNHEVSVHMYYELLDYYEFDVSNISGIPEKDKLLIQAYRTTKYSGKLTKRAIKMNN